MGGGRARWVRGAARDRFRRSSLVWRRATTTMTGRESSRRGSHLDFVAGVELGPDRDPGGSGRPAWARRRGLRPARIGVGGTRGSVSGGVTACGRSRVVCQERGDRADGAHALGIRPSRAAGRMRTVEDGRCGGERTFACESRTGRFRARRVVTTRLLSSTGHAPALAVCHIFGRAPRGSGGEGAH